MNARAGLHPLLVRQIAKSGGEALDLERLMALVSEAYRENDRDSARSTHAYRIMVDELDGTFAALELQNLRFRAALDNMGQGLCLFDASGCVAVCNRRFLDIYGFAGEDMVLGQQLPALLESSPVLTQAGDNERRGLFAEHLESSGNQTVELSWPDDRIITVNRTDTDDGGYLLTVSDITEIKLASERIAYLARHDSLTDLPNRVQLRERLQEFVRNARRNESCAVICLDLDRFKVVNDTLGHPIGDALLVAVAKRLKGIIREHDAIARLGGDEFAIVLQHIRQVGSVERFANRIVRALSKKFNINGHDVRIGTSIGIAIETAASLDPHEALRRADLALYAAKADGHGHYRIYTSELNEVAKARLQLEIDLRGAIERNEFVLHYQPQLDLETRRLSTIEALVRWNSPERGQVPPNDFIPICEEIGLIEELGRIVLETAMRDALGWPDETAVAVNLSAVQFQSGHLVQIVRNALLRTGLPAHRLELEVTENLMLEDTGRVLGQINDLKRLGCRISLDDFGIGYSSLSYIRQFPFDKIKIDKSFVRDLEHSADSLAIIRAVAGLCESLALKSTAEGVENAKQLEILRRKKIDSVQGFLICHPMASAQISDFISSVQAEEPIAGVVCQGEPDHAASLKTGQPYPVLQLVN